MAVGAFPLIKLAALAVRQISKPLANQIKNRAKNSPFFRNYICMPPAQMYHYFEVNVKMKLLGLGKPTNVAKLNEAAAIELGAELLGEGIIFMVAVLTLSAEYYRQSKKAAAEAAALEERWAKVEGKIDDLAYVAEKHAVEIRELRRLIYSNESNILKSLKWFSGEKSAADYAKPTGNNVEKKKQDVGPTHDNNVDNQDAFSGSVQEASEKIRFINK